METYIATVFAKPGSEDEVVSFYTELGPQYSDAKGFHGRQILKALPGTMLEAVKKVRTAEELAAHAEAEGPKGTHLIIIEQWENVDDRITFSKGLDGSRAAKLIPHLLPEHTHEFYTDITPD
jgi:hypothetical protein